MATESPGMLPRTMWSTLNIKFYLNNYNFLSRVIVISLQTTVCTLGRLYRYCAEVRCNFWKL